MSKFYNIMFFNSMLIGSLLTISSYSWLMMWLGMEINLMSIIPIIFYKKNNYSSESGMKYFLIQSLASTMMIFSIIMTEKSFLLTLNINHIFYSILQMSLMMKLGLAPFHSWFPETMEGLNWLNCFIFLTWQKIAPLMVMMMTLKLSMLLIMSIILSSLISGILGLNQISLRKILAYSSMNHLCWMILSMMYFSWIWMLYFLIYCFSNLNLIYFFSKFNLMYINQINLFSNNKMMKMFFLMNFLSLSGIPPMIGFFPKWLTISFLIYNNEYILPFILIISSLIHMYMYMRIFLSSLMLKLKQSKIKTVKYKNNYLILLINFNFIMFLPICNMMI